VLTIHQALDQQKNSSPYLNLHCCFCMVACWKSERRKTSQLHGSSQQNCA